jgi:hypothetical protein
MLSLGANEMLILISMGQLRMKVGDSMEKPTASTVARSGLVQVRPSNWFALEYTSRARFAVAAFWHAKRKRTPQRWSAIGGSKDGGSGWKNLVTLATHARSSRWMAFLNSQGRRR